MIDERHMLSGDQIKFERVYFNYTVAAIEDEFVKELHSRNKYIEQAKYLLYRINVFDPIPVFEISEKDIPTGLANEVESLDTPTKKTMITNAVRRLYASIDFDYYHTSGVYGRIKWRITD